MQSFLEEVIQAVVQKQDTLEDVIFVLPSKRAGTFLRNAIVKIVQRTSFSPEILSIESFVEKVSGLNYASHTQQLFELYKAYSDIILDEKNNFYTFSKWANTLLQDFNEIDRYLVDARKLFSNLTDIQEIAHWSPEFTKTRMMEDYLEFWNRLEPLYTAFNQRLLDQGLGHQGLVYRQAAEKLEDYEAKSVHKSHVFIGFNALNQAETRIIQRLISDDKNQIYWDIDEYFLNDPIHDAGFFLRGYLKNWPQLAGDNLKGASNHYLTKKNIQVVGLPKNVSQAKFVGGVLAELRIENGQGLKNTAVVLGDETLLNPLLNSIPKEINDVNITMGYPLGRTSLAGLFMQLINLYIDRETLGWYHRTILDFLSHPYTQLFLTDQGTNHARNISTDIISGNSTYIRNDLLVKMCQPQEKNLVLLFSEEILSPLDFLAKCLQIIDGIRIKLKANDDSLRLEHLYRFHRLFNQIDDLVRQHPFVDDLRSLKGLYQQLLAHETLDFKGEPLDGLQIMGMLESRNLDFETVILTSLNEGILPSGKSNNSFIPFDLKHNFGLPTYKEKDSVYTYHFYRLLQRAKNVYLLYNTEPDVLEGGEKSRLIMQLLTDKNKIGDITETTVAPAIIPDKKKLESIAKDSNLMDLIKDHASHGFSPTSLSNYIRNPIAFYKRNLLKIDDVLEVEETVAANTFGTIVHDTLEKIYAPFVGQVLEENQLKALKPKIRGLVKTQFERSYTGGGIGKGKNLIAFNVIAKYIANFIDLEIKEARNHKIRILGLEEKLRMKLNIPGLDFPIELKGKLDRIDEKDGELRIIDFKTGRVEKSQVEIVAWEDIITENDRTKAFQLLCYAKMYAEKENTSTLQAGIISIKKLNEGLMRFAIKESRNSRNKNTSITKDTIEQFSSQLEKLILQICDPEIPFTEKEV
ncbi:MAG: PD-(D/E)XK nuclease family protein [Aurantibacter sp.]